MKHTLKLGSLAVVGLFSVSTLAQVAVRARPEVRPEVTVKPNVTPQGQGLRGKFDNMKTGQVAANGNQPTADKCSRENVINTLVKRTGLNEGIVSTGLNKLVIQGCKAGEQGLLNFESNDAVKVAVLTGYYMDQNKLAGPAALAKAKEEVSGIATTAEAETAAFNSLLAGNPSSCNVFRN